MNYLDWYAGAYDEPKKSQRQVQSQREQKALKDEPLRQREFFPEEQEQQRGLID